MPVTHAALELAGVDDVVTLIVSVKVPPVTWSLLVPDATVAPMDKVPLFCRRITSVSEIVPVGVTDQVSNVPCAVSVQFSAAKTDVRDRFPLKFVAPYPRAARIRICSPD